MRDPKDLLKQGLRASLRVGHRASRRAGEVLDETRDAFRRGLRGEAPPPRRPPADDEQVATWYANLEVEPGADLDTVTRAWKALQRRYHPDMHADDPERAARAHELAQALNEAYRGLREHLRWS